MASTAWTPKGDNIMTMKQGTSKPVPDEVKNSRFGCRNCLWLSCECVKGSRFTPHTIHSDKVYPSCGAYTYYD